MIQLGLLITSNVVVTLKGYEFQFRLEDPCYVVEPDFVSCIWKKKPDDADSGKGKDMEEDEGQLGRSSDVNPSVVDGDVVMTNVQNSGTVVQRQSASIIAVTPFNPNPQTSRGKLIVAQARAKAANSGAAPSTIVECP